MEKNKHTRSRRLFTILGIVQILLATGMAYGGATKLFVPIEKLSSMWPWTGEVSVLLVRFTGICDLLGALGLTLPFVLISRQRIAGFAALGILLLMIIAGSFHYLRGEVSQIWFNVVFAGLAFFVVFVRIIKH